MCEIELYLLGKTRWKIQLWKIFIGPWNIRLTFCAAA